MSSDHSKSLGIKYINAIQQKDWNTLRSIIHDEISNKDDEGYAVNVDVWRNSHYARFMMLLGFSEEIIDEVGILNSYLNADDYLLGFKRLRNITYNWECVDIVAENDKIWIDRNYVIKDPLGYYPLVNAIVKLRVKDGKVFRTTSVVRYFNTLRQLGSLIFERNRKEQIDNYFRYLVKIGMMPKTSS